MGTTSTCAPRRGPDLRPRLRQVRGASHHSLRCFPSTAEKLIAGIVTRSGLIGAGIVRQKPRGQVHGLTTAAAIWAMAAVGVMAGSARFVLATGTALLFVFELEIRSLPLLSNLDARRWALLF